MTQDEIMEMARQVARQPDRIYAPDEKEFLYYFAKLAAAKERESCAKFFDDNDTNMFWGSQAASHIRARGEQA